MNSKYMYLKNTIFLVVFLKFFIASFKDLRITVECTFWYSQEASIWKDLLLIIWSLKSQCQNKSNHNISRCSQSWCWCVFQHYLCSPGAWWPHHGLSKNPQDRVRQRIQSFTTGAMPLCDSSAGKSFIISHALYITSPCTPPISHKLTACWAAKRKN